MSGHAPNFEATLQTIPGRSVPKMVKLACFLGILIGIAGLAYGLFAGTSDDVHRVQGAFLTNFMYFNGIAQGGFMFCAIGMVTYARWHRRFKRIAEAFAVFLPISYLLLLAFMVLGGIDAYPWAHEEMPAHKAIYFKKGFYLARLVIGLGLMTLLSLLYVKHSLGADLYVVSKKMQEKGLEVPASWSTGFFKAGNFTSDKEAVESAQHKMLYMAAPIIVLYALIYSMIAVDVSMSLAPHWYANMFPAWYFMSAGWSGLVWTAIFAILCGKWLGIENLIRPKDMHDIGKLTFAFCMFWGYTTFAHYLPIWYGNMTEEIGYILIRTHGETFSDITILTMILCFIAPWTILLSRGIKKIRKAYLGIAFVMAIGIWLERYVVNMVSVHTYHMPEAPLPLCYIELAVTLGFLGAFVLAVTSFLAKYPGATVSDPFMHNDPSEIEVHAGDH
jgi:hypothetical protein